MLRERRKQKIATRETGEHKKVIRGIEGKETGGEGKREELKIVEKKRDTAFVS